METAKLLQEALSKRGYRVFLDVESLRSGPFNKQLYKVIEEVNDVLVVLPENALDRCSEEKDWFRLEIEHAHECRKNIVPIALRGFDLPDEMPESLEFLRTQQIAKQAPMEFFDLFVDKLARQYLTPRRKVDPKILGIAAAVVALAVILYTVISSFPFPGKGGTLSADTFHEWVAEEGLNKIIKKVSILNTTKDAGANAVDLSENGDRSVLGWKEGNTLYLAGNNGITAPEDCSYLFSAEGAYNNEELQWSKLQEITGAELLDMSNTKDMRWMFYCCSSLKRVDVSKWKIGQVKSLQGTFNRCSSLEDLGETNVKSWNVSQVENMHTLFLYCQKLTALDVSGWNTSNVDNMAWMFKGCESLTELNVSGFQTGKVINLQHMFYQCKNLNSLDVSTWDTSNVGNIPEDKKENSWYQGGMKALFNGCESLTSLGENNVKEWNTENVDDMGWMFYNCKKLEELDVSGFQTGNVVNMKSMFNGCSSLKSLEVSSWDTSNVGNVPEDRKEDDEYNGGMDFMFKDCASLTSLGEKGVSDWALSDKVTTYKMFAGTKWEKNPPVRSPLTQSTLSKDKLTEWACAETTSRNSIEKIVFLDTLRDAPEDALDFSEEQDRGVLAWLEGNALYIAGNRKIMAPNDCSYLFSDENAGNDNYAKWKNVQSVENAEFLDTSMTESMKGMFAYCLSLQTLDVSKWDTSSVKDMKSMFYDCESISSLDVSGFLTGNVKNFYCMFYNCKKLKELPISYGDGKWDTSSVEDMSHMFDGCASLPSLDVSGFNTANVTNMSYMFYDCGSLPSLDVSGFNTAKVTNMSHMFFDCGSLSSLDVSGFDTSKVTDMYSMFYGCKNLEELRINYENDKWNTSSVDNMAWMFGACESLPTVDVSNFKVEKVITMRSMFQDCKNLKEIDVSSWTPSNVGKIPENKADDSRYAGSLKYMFIECSSLESLGETGVSNWSVSEDAETTDMFKGTKWENDPPL